VGRVAPAHVFRPGVTQYGLPFSAFVLLTVAYSDVIGWVIVHAQVSELVASLLHGAINPSQGLCPYRE
jgi:TRAP-type C4-dicarboxylate transport system permease large subunit